MLGVHTILHPTDFSEHSQSAFGLACALARDYGARLLVLHVAAVPTVVYGEGVLPPNPEEIRAAAQEQLDRLTVPDANLRAERLLREGDAAAEILRSAVEANADLIVMGTHGRTGLERLLLGSVAEHVLRKAPCPLLIVKAPFPASPSTSATAREGARSAANVT
jgi:nucleotide-binding universal stress UspA family protein